MFAAMKFRVNHPSEVIPRKYTDVISQPAAEAESLGDLHPDQMDLVYRQKWFKIFIPKEYNGLGLSLPEALKLEESLSWADGSTAWVVTLCGGAGWFSGFLESSLLKEVLSNDKVCFAGSGAATGIASRTSGGYIINGQWKYASGSLHATVFTANCVLQKDGATEHNKDGSPRVAAFLFHKEEVILHALWKSMGMIATGSHSFAVNQLVVPENRRFTVDGKHALLKDPVYQYPFMQLAETTLSVNLSGLAVRFMDLCDALFSERIKHQDGSGSTRRVPHERLAAARVAMDQYRHDFYSAVETSWDICRRGDVIPRGILNQTSKKSYALAQGALRLVDELYPWCGLVAADPRSEINRVWRNIHTASQHALFRTG